MSNEGEYYSWLYTDAKKPKTKLQPCYTNKKNLSHIILFPLSNNRDGKSHAQRYLYQAAQKMNCHDLCHQGGVRAWGGVVVWWVGRHAIRDMAKVMHQKLLDLFNSAKRPHHQSLFNFIISHFLPTPCFSDQSNLICLRTIINPPIITKYDLIRSGNHQIDRCIWSRGSPKKMLQSSCSSNFNMGV